MIGVFDSGLGGLSVLTHVRRLLPDADLLYLADRARAPYGRRSLAEVRDIAMDNTVYLTGAGSGMIVLACNTASAAALHHLRGAYPEIAFVGMEPAVKPATAVTRTGVIGVLATEATFQGALFGSLVDRYGGEVTVLPRPCPGWAELVERGETHGARAAGLVERYVRPLILEGADTLVLGCTHYPFLVPLIARAAGPGVEIIDPSPAVAEQVRRVAGRRGDERGSGLLRFVSTGNPDGVAGLVRRLAGFEVEVTVVT
jgi:glutamate racemase